MPDGQPRLSPLFTWRTAVTDDEFGAAPRTGKKVSAAAMRHVALTLTLYMNEAGGSAFPGNELLIGRTMLAKSTVVQALTELVATDWLKKKKGGGRGRSTTYRATIPETVRQSYLSRIGADPETVRLSVANSPTVGPHHVNTATGSDEAAPHHRQRDPVWDALEELFDPPTKRGRAGRGRIAQDFKDLAAHAGVSDPEQVAAEVRRRHAALEAEWGSRATARSLVEHWATAGRLADKRAGNVGALKGLDDIG